MGITAAKPIFSVSEFGVPGAGVPADFYIRRLTDLHHAREEIGEDVPGETIETKRSPQLQHLCETNETVLRKAQQIEAHDLTATVLSQWSKRQLGSSTEAVSKRA